MGIWRLFKDIFRHRYTESELNLLVETFEPRWSALRHGLYHDITLCLVKYRLIPEDSEQTLRDESDADVFIRSLQAEIVFGFVQNYMHILSFTDFVEIVKPILYEPNPELIIQIRDEFKPFVPDPVALQCKFLDQILDYEYSLQMEEGEVPSEAFEELGMITHAYVCMYLRDIAIGFGDSRTGERLGANAERSINYKK